MKAVISGGTRGIGRGIAEKLATQGFDLVILARKEDQLRQCKSELSNSNIVVQTLAIDLSKKNTFQILEANADLFTNTNLLVNNLGIYSMQNATNIKIEELTTQIETNLFSAINLTQFLLQKDLNSKLTNIVNIASVMSIHAQPFAADYGISKHAFKGWNDALRKELRLKKIKVSAIFPGSVNTSSWDGIEVNRTQMIQAEDIAECVSCILKMETNTLLDEIHISPITFTP